MNNPVPTLFLLNSIFYPKTVIPLTVNDDISKKMLLFCYKNNMDIALYHPQQKSLGIATLGKIILVDKETLGSQSVVVQGLRRVKLLTMECDSPIPKYFNEKYNDHDEQPHMFANFFVERLHQVLLNWINCHVHSAEERKRFIGSINSPDKLINNLCMLLIKDLGLKQIFLESQSLLERVRMMNALLVGETPENENTIICEAIKDFERQKEEHYENAS